MKKIVIILSICSLLFPACTNSVSKATGYGNFEAIEITISAEHAGKLVKFNLKEGDMLSNGAKIGLIDTIQLNIKKEQLEASKNIVSAKSRAVLSEISILKAKLATAEIQKERLENLFKDQAATQKQLDDIQGEINIIQEQIKSIKTQNAPVVNELLKIDLQIKELQDQLKKCVIINPIEGTVLVKYTEENEVVSFGKPLYKIADLSTMQLRAYIAETQLANIAIGQKVQVRIDQGDHMKTYEGSITWIASESEFTPKIIQTKEERVSSVYAIKIDVINDGSIKIGMPGELWTSFE